MKRRDVLKGLAAIGAAAALPAPAIGQQAASKVLKVGYGSSLSSLDPVWTTANSTNEVAFQIYDQLVAIDDKYVARPQMVEGWTLEDGNKTYNFRLREGLKFHNGEKVTAADCVPSIKRWSVRDGTGQAIASMTDSMEVVDDRNFRIRLKRPFASLPDALAKANSSQCVVMPKYLAETDPLKQVAEPIGSGPFKFIREEWVPGVKVAFSRFTDYVPRNEPVDGLAGGRAAKIDRMEWLFMSDAATAANALITGELDYLPTPAGDLIPILQADPGITVFNRARTGTYYTLVMNHLQKPFDNPAIRQALAMAINQDDFVAAMGVPKDSGGACNSMFMCGTRYGTTTGSEVLTVRSVDKAKAALKAAGYAGEKVVFLLVNDPPTLGAISQVTADVLRRVGFNVDVISTDFATMIQRRNNKEPVDKGGWSVFNSTWGGAGLLDPLANSLLRGSGPTAWFGWPVNPRIEELRDSWFGTTDPAEQDKLVTALQVEAFKTLPYIPLAYSLQINAWSKKLQGVFPSSGLPFWNITKA